MVESSAAGAYSAIDPHREETPSVSDAHDTADGARLSGDGLDVEIADGIALLAFNRPHRRNALDLVNRVLFAEALDVVCRDPAIRVIVLTGRGGHFCSGGDLGSMKGGDDGGISAEAGRQRMRDGLRGVERLLTCDKPVVAAVEGIAYGGGFGIALAADMIVAGESARFCMSFARVGLLPDSGALYTLPRIVGLQRAKELMLSGREIDAATALSYGIAMEVVGAGRALDRAMQLARALAQASPVAAGMTKAALNLSLSSDLRTMLEFEATGQGVAFSSSHHRAAVRRFLDKQPPSFVWPAAPKP
jgi:2-(1,2-epoxy-1,2-dihydrophenyl)acetyl-CoA isomerase